MTDLTREQALQELGEFVNGFKGGGHVGMGRSYQFAIGERLEAIADALAKPELGLDWQTGSELEPVCDGLGDKEIIVEHPDGHRSVYSRADRESLRRWLKHAKPEEADKIIRFAEIPTGDAPEIAKPEIGLDYISMEEMADDGGDDGERFLVFAPDGPVITDDLFTIQMGLRVGVKPGYPKGTQFARIPLPKGEDND